MVSEALKYLRLALATRRHLASPLDPDPENTVRGLLQNRDSNFLALAKAVLADASHPYAQLFAVAGRSYSDLEHDVHRDGLEAALESLAAAGVYLTHDEFRGRKEIVRGGRHIPATIECWRNHLGRGHFETSSSGTSGGAHTTSQNSANLQNTESSVLLLVRELDLAHCLTVNLGPVLPGSGIVSALIANRLHLGFERWFALGGGARRNLHYRLVTQFMVRQMRWFGAKVPDPIYLEHNDYRPVAEYLASCSARHQATAFAGFVSSVARVAAAALDRGLDLKGCRAIVYGEALTDAKRSVIEAAGIEVYPTYGTSDFGSIGYPCSQMRSGNCVHVFAHGIALISRRPEVSWSDSPVNSLFATSVLPFAPRFFINVEIGDTGILEPARCDCLFSRLGFHQQVRDIAAISKVTAQGMTISADDLVPLLEERLPSRFGGRPGDYQLAEVEGRTQTEMVLRIRPGVATSAPEAILAFFLEETRRVYGGSLSIVAWAHSDGIRAELTPPILAATGKFRAIRLLGPGIGNRFPGDGVEGP